jgi:hypothetical protein
MSCTAYMGGGGGEGRRCSLEYIKPRQDDQHGVHPVWIDERKSTALYGAAKKNLCLVSMARTQ